MSSDQVALIHHRVKGTLQQVDMAFKLMTQLSSTDKAAADEIRQELVNSLTRITEDLKALDLN